MNHSTDSPASAKALRRLLPLLFLSLSACVSIPTQHDRLAPLQGALQSRHPDAEHFLPDPAEALSTTEQIPLTDLSAARALALRNDPALRETMVALGISETLLIDAQRPGNPSLSWLRHRSNGEDAGTQWSMSLGITDLLWLPQRRRVALQEREEARTELQVQVSRTLAETDAAWYEWIGARVAAQASGLLREATELSLALAERFDAAGNLEPLDLARYRADAAAASIAHRQAQQEEDTQAHALLMQLGVAGDSGVLPKPSLIRPDSVPELSTLLDLSRQFNPDRQRAMAALARSEANLQYAQRSAWLGDMELEIERESRPQEALDTAVGLHWQLPLFSQGQTRRQRARWQHQLAQTALQRSDLQRIHAVQSLHAQLTSQLAQIDDFEQRLLPALSEALDAQQRRQNYMLSSVFDLLQTRREQFAAAREYVTVVARYWQTLAELSRVVGSDLPVVAAERPRIELDRLLGLGRADIDPHAGHTAKPTTPADHTGHHHHEN